LTVEISIEARESDKSEVCRIEHQLDAHEDNDRVTANDNTNCTNGK
jgi:hypothetical protein